MKRRNFLATLGALAWAAGTGVASKEAGQIQADQALKFGNPPERKTIAPVDADDVEPSLRYRVTERFICQTCWRYGGIGLPSYECQTSYCSNFQPELKPWRDGIASIEWAR